MSQITARVPDELVEALDAAAVESEAAVGPKSSARPWSAIWRTMTI